MKRQRNPLEIPELLTLIGSYLPLWKHTSPSLPSHGTFIFQPKTLVACLKVSRLWYRTLLPILWYGYWAASMDATVSEAVVGKYSHLFRVLDLIDRSAHRRPFGNRDMSAFRCRNLIELRVHTGTREGQKRLVKQLLRDNPGIRTLEWLGDEFEHRGFEDTPILDAEDFMEYCAGGGGGGNNLKTLFLEFWDCSGTGTNSGGEQLRKILRTVGGSLEEFDFEQIQDTSPDIFFSASQALGEEEEGLYGESIQLAKLERLGIGDCGYVDRCSAELVKCCPKLKKLHYSARHDDESIERLAVSIQQHCLEFDSLDLFELMDPDPVETLIRHCPRQLRFLHFSVMTFESVGIDRDQGQNQSQGGLLSAILEHAKTLEDVSVRKVFGRDAGPFYLPLLVECTRLKRFTFSLSGISSDDRVLLKALRQRVWSGSRGTLEELVFETQYRRGGIESTAITKEEMRRMASEMGWEEENVEDNTLNICV
ncbi:hypothetical protein EC991_011057 [Linnemannia zychae]|nr:hypothetical protein EC991_011057 [Linnemannia zychae]